MSEKCKVDLDPEVYEFYRAALEGPGFDVPFSVDDVEWLREDEVRRHAAHTEPYEVYEKFDKFIQRKGRGGGSGDDNDADPLMVRVYIPECVHKARSAVKPQKADAAGQCAAVGQAAARIKGKRSEDAEGGAPVLLYFHGGAKPLTRIANP